MSRFSDFNVSDGAMSARTSHLSPLGCELREGSTEGLSAMDLTHFDEAGRAHMVDVGEKAETTREAVATGRVRMQAETLRRIREGSLRKGDVLAVAQVAGVMAAKQTPQIIPMCHTILLTGVDITFELAEEDAEGLVGIQASVRTFGKTGAEMEALTAVSATALTIYDMCKAIDRGMVIEQVRLERKSGGKSGDFTRTPDAGPDA
jgi:cyclic pyranopterin monophosphate synthase